MFAFALIPAAAVAAISGSATGHAAHAHATRDSDSAPIVDRIVGVRTPALAHPRTSPGARTAPRAVAAPRLAASSGYRQAGGSKRVRRLQRRLAVLGFTPGPIDGRYGPLTTTSVRRFQRARRQRVSGIAGARTLRALGSLQPPPRNTARRHESRPAVSAVTGVPEGGQGEPSPSLPVAPVLLGLVVGALATMSMGYRSRGRVRCAGAPDRGRVQPAHGASARGELVAGSPAITRRLSHTHPANQAHPANNQARPANQAHPANQIGSAGRTHPGEQARLPSPAGPVGRAQPVSVMPTSDSPARRRQDRPPVLPIAPVLLAIAALGLGVRRVVRSKVRTRVRGRHRAVRGAQAIRVVIRVDGGAKHRGGRR